MLTWRSHDARRMESVRVQLSGKRIKANGRIVAAEADSNPAFAAYYDLLTDETGATKRLGMTVTLAERERQLVVARDEENMWMVTGHHGESRAAYDGALDVDVVFSPFFNALPLIVAGLRTATLQIVATATVAAYASLGGLGRYLIDGIKVRQFHIALVGALMVAALALILDGVLAFAVWASVPGTGRLRRRTHHQASNSAEPSPNVDA